MTYCYNCSGNPFPLYEPSLEPPDVNEPEPEEKPSCKCVECGQDVWSGEYTFDGLCPDCFQKELLNEWTLQDIAEQLGYNVVLR